MDRIPTSHRAAGPRRIGRIGRIAAPVALALIALAGAAPPAAACQMQPTPWGPRLTGCDLKSFFPELQLDISRDPRPTVWPLPNLRIPNASFLVQGLTIDLSVQVQNTSPGLSARATNLSTLVTANEVGTARTLGAPFPFLTAVVALPRASTRWQRLGMLTLPDRRRDWDICVSSTIDPPTRTSAVGLVVESDETDNTYGECCRLYSPTTTEPDHDAPGSC